MRSLLILLLLIASAIAGPPGKIPTITRAAAAGGAAPTYILEENFEGTGYDETVTGSWSEQGVVNEDYTATVLQGAQSCLMEAFDAFAATDFEWTAGMATAYFYCRFRFDSLPPGGSGEVFRIFSASEAQSCRVFVNDTGTLVADSEGVFAANTVSAMSVNTTYHVWVQATKGTGANGVLTVAFSTDGTRPTSGNNFTSISTGAMTQDAKIIRLEAQDATNWDYIVDRVLIDDVQIGNSP